MTAATPILDPTAEPLLDVPDRRVCECYAENDVCPHAATWAATLSGPCTDGPGTATWLLCELHKRGFLRDGAAECYGCGAILTITRIEAL